MGFSYFRGMRIACTFTLSFIYLLQITGCEKTIPLKGKVVRSINGEALSTAIVQINYQNRQTFTDTKGNFSFDSLPAGDYTLKAIYAGYPIKELSVRVVKGLSNSVVVVMSPPCAYDEHKKDKTCPFCHRQDVVVPIRWGLIRGEMDTAHYYYGGCEVTGCDPNWYCKLDRKSF